jgi:hypothetical protein
MRLRLFTFTVPFFVPFFVAMLMLGVVLLSLADYGGPTWSMALGAGSPAINVAALVNCPPTDQRGVAAIGLRTRLQAPGRQDQSFGGLTVQYA